MLVLLYWVGENYIGEKKWKTSLIDKGVVIISSVNAPTWTGWSEKNMPVCQNLRSPLFLLSMDDDAFK